jgi:hypothetical protein
MVTQAKTPKVSSAAKAFLKRLLRAPSPQRFWGLLQRERNRMLLYEVLDRHLYERRKRLLFDLANLHDLGFLRFKRVWERPFFRVQFAPSEQCVLELRDDLRKVWDVNTPIFEKHKILEGWVTWHPSPPQRPFGRIGFVPFRTWRPILHTGKIEPVVWSLPAQLVQGVLEQFKYFAVCRNPSCPTAFFLAKRSDQRYCERGECTAYAQRRYALKWWHGRGKKQRGASEIGKKRRKRR